MEFEVKMTSNILLSYLFRQNYRSFAGLLTIGLGIMMIALFIYNGNAIALLAGAIVLFYPPWSLFTKSKKQMLLNPAFKNPLKYRIDDQGIQVSQGDDVVFVLWEQLFRVIATKKSILIYTSPVNAWILPRKDLGGNAELLKSTIITNMPAAKIKNMK